MSTVLEAFDRRLERHVAVKLLAEHLAEDKQFVARFRREALSAARLVHPNIVQVFDFGLDERSGRHYIVMELIRGQSGAEILRDRGRARGRRRRCRWSLQACRGLDYAHRNGVVHRDVKPGNLLRAEDGDVKLADFGIAKAVTDESAITQVGSVLGTAAYLAPEQAARRGGRAAGGHLRARRRDLPAARRAACPTRRSRSPSSRSSSSARCRRRCDELNPDVTPALAVAVDRALALDPRRPLRPAPSHPRGADRRRARRRARPRRARGRAADRRDAGRSAARRPTARTSPARRRAAAGRQPARPAPAPRRAPGPRPSRRAAAAAAAARPPSSAERVGCAGARDAVRRSAPRRRRDRRGRR